MFKKRVSCVLLTLAVLASACGCEKENYYENENNDNYTDSSELKKVIFAKEGIQMDIGTEEKLEYILIPSGGIVKSCVFESSDESVVSVDDTGKLIALKVGSATIKATFNETLTCECDVTVTELPNAVFEGNVPSKAYKNDTFEMAVTLNEFDCGMIKIISEGISGTAVCGEEEISFNDENSEVCFVGNEFDLSFTLTANEGSGSISVFCYNNGIISDAYTRTIEVLSNKLSVFPAEITVLVGESAVLAASDANGVSWSSSDTAVASVNSGTVTAKKVGTAVITASNGKASGTLKVNVIEPPAEEEDIQE